MVQMHGNLRPKTQKEMDSALSHATNDELYNLWEMGTTDPDLEMICYEELVKRNARRQLGDIKNTIWYSKVILKKRGLPLDG